jgi:hypothetical protein
LIDQHPIGLDVAVPKSLPVSAERMISMTWSKRLAKAERFHDVPQSIDILSALPQSFQIAFK